MDSSKELSKPPASVISSKPKMMMSSKDIDRSNNSIKPIVNKQPKKEVEENDYDDDFEEQQNSKPLSP